MLQYNDFSALGIDEEVSGKCVMADFSRDPDRDKPSQPTEMHEALLCGIGRLIFSWGKLEVHLEQKVAQLRKKAGDVRAKARISTTMDKRLADLSDIVSMRKRWKYLKIASIGELERNHDQIDQFRSMEIQ